MLNQFSRTQLLLGPDAMESLYGKKVAVFGIGGVGGYVCEALVRSGIGSFDLIDDDKVCLTNLNRQIIATRKTVGKYKAEVMRDRMLEINPDAKIEIHKCFFLPENADDFPFSEYDYIVDAVDTVTAKIELIIRAQKEGIPIISAMGAGNKLDAGRLKIADIYDTKICPLARVMRRELKKRNVKKLKVVYSDEQPIRPLEDMSISCRTHCICPPGAQHKCTERRDIPGSTAFVPAVAGLLIAGEIVKDLCGNSAIPAAVLPLRNWHLRASPASLFGMHLKRKLPCPWDYIEADTSSRWMKVWFPALPSAVCLGSGKTRNTAIIIIRR